MSDLHEAYEQFKTTLGDFLLAIQTIRKVDTQMFQKLCLEADELARILKGQPLVLKSLLNQFRVASKILRAEAPYIKDQTSHLIKMADDLDYIFDLILIGECRGDRVPGVPRII